MRSAWFGVPAMMALLSSAPALPKEPVRLQPASPWNLQYAPDSCRLVRVFGEGRQRLTLVLDSYEPGNYIRATLVGDGLDKHGLTGIERLSLRFVPNEETSDLHVTWGSAGKVPAAVVGGSLRIVPLTPAQKAEADDPNRKAGFYDPPVDPARLAAVTALQIRYKRTRHLELMTGSMAKPFQLLDNCAWETVASWGLDVEQQKKLSRGPVALGTPWLRSSDYPNAMLNAGYQGIIRVRLMIDASGKPTSCAIQQSTRPEEFDNTVCRALMARAKFEPALDAQGAPAPSFWSQTIQFRIQT